MDELIEAFQIFKKYVEPGSYEFKFPTACEHDVLMILGVEPGAVSSDDLARLEELSFTPGNEWGDNGFSSHKFGSC